MQLIKTILLCLSMIPGFAICNDLEDEDFRNIDSQYFQSTYKVIKSKTFDNMFNDLIPDKKNHRRRIIICIARNGRGYYFTGRAIVRSPYMNALRIARMRALRMCHFYSYRPWSCRVVRCQFNWI